MLLIGKKILFDFTGRHPDALNWIEIWIAEVEGNQWKTPKEIKKRYSDASFLSDNVVIFNVKGNTYRLEVKITYNSGIILAKWAGTHSEYDKRNKKRRDK